MARKDPPEIDHPYVFSVSQAETFILCPRKWAYNKIDGIEDPGNDASDLGGLVHEQLEEYLEHGTPISTGKAGKIAMSALPYLPPPRYPGMRIEAWFHVKIGDYQGKHGVGAYYRGLKDLEIPNGWTSPRPFVSDHKTTKNFMWAKSGEDLTGGEFGVGNVQAGVYAYDTMLQQEVSEVDLQWTYMRTTSSPKAEPSIAVINREQVDRIIHRLEIVTAEMIRTKDENPTASTVERDPRGCDAFKGCPYQGRCFDGVSSKEIVKLKWTAIMSQTKKENSVLEKLKARKAKKAGAGGDSAPAETAGPKPSTEEAAEDEGAAINPPEGENAPVVTVETQEQAKIEKAAAKAAKKGTTSRSSSAGAASEPVGPSGEKDSGSVLGRAASAFWDVVIDDLASRIAEKIRK